MSEKIYLRVPSHPEAEFISVGNLEVTLVPGEVAEVDNRQFADWLVREHGLAEIDKPKAKKARATPDEPVPSDDNTEEKTDGNPPAEIETNAGGTN